MLDNSQPLAKGCEWTAWEVGKINELIPGCIPLKPIVYVVNMSEKSFVMGGNVKGVFSRAIVPFPLMSDMSYRPCALLMSRYETSLWYIVMAVLTRHFNVFEQCDYYNNEVTVQHTTITRPTGQGRV
jgi:hypothetical protein